MMRRRDSSHIQSFMELLRRDFPDLNREQITELARQRDAGIAAADRLVSTVYLSAAETGLLVADLAAMREAIRLLTLQGLPWAFRRASLWYRADASKALDAAVDSATKCAWKVDPLKGCLSTLIAKDVYYTTIRRIKCQEKSEMHIAASIRDRIATDNGHEDHADLEKRRLYLMGLIARLPERERMIMEMRAVGATLNEIGKYLGVSKERVRQLIKLAMYSLKTWAGVANGAEKDRYCQHQRGLKRRNRQRRRVVVA